MLPRLARTACLLVSVLLVAACSGQAAGRSGDEGSRSSGTAAAAPIRAHLEVSAPIVQPGPGVAPADEADVVVQAQFAPAEEGRRVTIQRRGRSADWQDVAARREDAQGQVRYVGPAHDDRRRAFAYRALVRGGLGERTVASPARSARQWQLKFDEEFDGSALDPVTWAYRQEGVYAPASDRACSASSRDAVDVEDGQLVLSAVEDQDRNELGPCDAEDGNTRSDQSWYRNGHISTQGTQGFTFRYGYAAARMKFDSRQGAHGSFWMQSTVPAEAGKGAKATGAEVDVVESFGDAFAKWHKPNSIYSFVYYRNRHGKQVKVPGDDDPRQAITRADAGLDPGDSWSMGYHVFGVRWTPERYVFYVDGVPTQTVDRGVSHVPEVLILSMLTSGWELGHFPSGADLQTDVDWVRVWQRPGGTCSGGPTC